MIPPNADDKPSHPRSPKAAKARAPKQIFDLPLLPCDALAGDLVKVVEKLVRERDPGQSGASQDSKIVQNYIRDWLKSKQSQAEIDQVVLAALELQAIERVDPAFIPSVDALTRLQSNEVFYAIKLLKYLSGEALGSELGLRWLGWFEDYCTNTDARLFPGKLLMRIREEAAEFQSAASADYPLKVATRFLSFFEGLESDPFADANDRLTRLLEYRQFSEVPQCAAEFVSLVPRAEDRKDAAWLKRDLKLLIDKHKDAKAYVGRRSQEEMWLRKGLIFLLMKQEEINQGLGSHYLLLLDAWEIAAEIQGLGTRGREDSLKGYVLSGIENGDRFLAQAEQGIFTWADDGGDAAVGKDPIRRKGFFVSRLADLYRIREKHGWSDPESWHSDLTKAIDWFRWSFEAMGHLNESKVARIKSFALPRMAECYNYLGRLSEGADCLREVTGFDAELAKACQMENVLWQAFRSLGLQAGWEEDHEEAIRFFRAAACAWEPQQDICVRQTRLRECVLLHADLCQVYEASGRMEACREQALFYLGAVASWDKSEWDFGSSKVISLALRAMISAGLREEAEDFAREYLKRIQDPRWRLRPLGCIVGRTQDPKWQEDFRQTFRQAAASDSILSDILGRPDQFAALADPDVLFEYVQNKRAEILAGGAREVITELAPMVSFRRHYWLDGGDDHPQLMVLFGIANRMIGEIGPAVGTLLYARSLSSPQHRPRIEAEIAECYLSSGEWREALAWFNGAFERLPHSRSLAGILECHRKLDNLDTAIDRLFGRESNLKPEHLTGTVVRQFRESVLGSERGLSLLPELLAGNSLALDLLERLIGPDLQAGEIETLAREISRRLLGHGELVPCSREAVQLTRMFRRVLAVAKVVDCSAEMDRILEAILSSFFSMQDRKQSKLLTMTLICGGWNSALFSVLWRFAEAARRSIHSSHPDEVIQDFNELLMGVAWRKLLPENWGGVAILPAEMILRVSALRLRSSFDVIQCGRVPGMIRFEDACRLRHEVEPVLADPAGPLGLLHRLPLAEMEWRRGEGLELTLFARLDLREYDDPAEAWRAIMHDILAAWTGYRDRNGAQAPFAKPQDGDSGRIRIKVGIPTMPGAGPLIQQENLSALDEYLNGIQDKLLACCSKSVGDAVSGAVSHLPNGPAGGTRKWITYLKHRLDQDYALCLANLLGLTPRTKPRDSWHPAHNLHPLKNRIRSLLGRQDGSSVPVEDLETDFVKAYVEMAAGYRRADGGEQQFTTKIATSLDTAVRQLIRESGWNERRISFAGLEGAYAAAAPATVEKILRALLENAFWEARDGNSSSVEIRLSRLDSIETERDSKNSLPSVPGLVEISNQRSENSLPRDGSTELGIEGARLAVLDAGGKWFEPLHAGGVYCQQFTLPLLP